VAPAPPIYDRLMSVEEPEPLSAVDSNRLDCPGQGTRPAALLTVVPDATGMLIGSWRPRNEEG